MYMYIIILAETVLLNLCCIENVAMMINNCLIVLQLCCIFCAFSFILICLATLSKLSLSQSTASKIQGQFGLLPESSLGTLLEIACTASNSWKFVKFFFFFVNDSIISLIIIF